VTGTSARLGPGPAPAASAHVPQRARTAGVSLEAGLAFLVAALYLGALVRLVHILAAGSFPLNDGGMFYAMASDVKANGYALPQFTSYNGGGIPFAYSPLSFYLTALLSETGLVSTLDLIRFLPFVASMLTVPAFFILANSMMTDRRMAGLATVFFALVPRAFDWQIVGGGLTRSFGLLFALLAIAALYACVRAPSWRRSLGGGALLGLTALCHMEMAWFAGFSYAAVLAAYGRTPVSLRHAAASLAAAAAVSAPWWATVLAVHGQGPFFAAMDSAEHSVIAPLKLLLVGFTDEPFIPAVLALGLLGVLGSLVDRRFFLPAWLLLIFLLDPRKAPTYATVPLSMLAAYGVYTLLLPRLQGPLTQAGKASPPWAAKALLAGLCAYATVGGLAAAAAPGSPLVSLPAGERAAYAWISENTPAEARILASTGEGFFATDPRSEWLPALTGRRSVATVQGTEWLAGDRGMVASRARYDDLQDCAAAGTDCLRDWAARNGQRFDYVYVAKCEGAAGEGRDCCAALRAALREDASYALVYEGRSSQLYERLR